MNLKRGIMMATIKCIDEIIISGTIRYLDLTSPMEYIYFIEEIKDNVGQPRKKYTVKFDNEEDVVSVYLTDVPFKIENGYATYEILYSTSWGRFYMNDNPKMNSVEIMTNYKDLADFQFDYVNRPNKEVGTL
jgi:hypothetical protein